MQLRFRDTRLLALGAALPDEIIESRSLEDALAPLYSRLGLAEGRLELMTGIRSRGFFRRGTLPSDISVRAAEDLFQRTPIARSEVDCVIHASVCRDNLEPATAAVVHARLGLSESCLAFDLSNACLSALSALGVAAALLETRQARTVLVVSGEDARTVVESTVRALNADKAITRRSLKPSLASLTLGSGGSAALLSREHPGAEVLGGSAFTASRFHSLCKGEGDGADVKMETDSEAMLIEGVALAARTWKEAREVLGWEQAERYFLHQVGSAHRNRLMETLGLDLSKDYSVFSSLGNMGAAAVGISLTLGARQARPSNGDRVALLGIGSGLVCQTMGLKWSNEVSL